MGSMGVAGTTLLVVGMNFFGFARCLQCSDPDGGREKRRTGQEEASGFRNMLPTNNNRNNSSSSSSSSSNDENE